MLPRWNTGRGSLQASAVVRMSSFCCKDLVTTPPFLDSCVILEGDGSDSLLPTQFRPVSIVGMGYRYQSKVTHLGEGRCAFIGTHFARYTWTYACTCEGAHWQRIFFHLRIHIVIVALALALVTLVRMQIDLFSSGRTDTMCTQSSD